MSDVEDLGFNLNSHSGLRGSSGCGVFDIPRHGSEIRMATSCCFWHVGLGSLRAPQVRHRFVYTVLIDTYVLIIHTCMDWSCLWSQ